MTSYFKIDRWIFICLLIFISLFKNLSYAEDCFSVNPSGRVFTDFYVPFYPSLQTSQRFFQQDSLSAWIEASPKWNAVFGEKVYSKFNLSINALGESTVHTGEILFRLREGYIGYSGENWEVRAGQMIIPWGKMDGVSVTDFLSAKDYSFFNPDDEVKRLGSGSILGNWTPLEGLSPWTITGILTPLYPKSKLLIAPGQLPSQVVFNQDQSLSYHISEWETALRIAYAGSFWDFSILGFRGWNHLPELQLESINLISQSLKIKEVFHRYTAVGIDFSSSVSSWIFRGESSYIWTENSNGTNPLIQPSSLNVALGVERPVAKDFRIHAQFLVRYYPSWRPLDQLIVISPDQLQAQQIIAKQNALIQNYQNSIRPLSTFRVSYDHEDSNIASELFFMGNLRGGGYLIRPQMSYSWTEALKSTLGIEYYNGPKDRPLGVMHSLSNFYTELKWIM